MKFGNRWFKETIVAELQEVCENKISSYYRWRLNTRNERFAHVFLCEFNEPEELEIYWKRVVNNIAVYVQSELDNLLERSNFYIWFWVKKEVDENLKREIENDKYSAKKFVITIKNSLSEEEKLARIESHIFKFKFLPKTASAKMIQEVELQNFRAFKGKNTFSFCRENGDIARLVVLYAENGRGKTSFFDGIEWNLTGDVSRVALMGNKKVNGKILKSTEIQDDENAYVQITMNDDSWIKRNVDDSGKDFGTGKRMTSGNNNLAEILEKEERWNNILLPHHKIDGFVSALKPEEWYAEWGDLWDPDNFSREKFELAYRSWRSEKKRHSEILENLNQANLEYNQLDKGRNYVEKLEYDVQTYSQLSKEKDFDSLNLYTMTDIDYLKWCSKINILLNHIQKEMTKISHAYRYYQTEFMQDYNQYILECDKYNRLSES